MIRDVPRQVAAAHRAPSSDDARRTALCSARHYELALDIDLKAGRYVGRERIRLELSEATESITLHCAGPQIAALEARQDGDRARAEVIPDPEQQLVRVVFDHSLLAGDLTLDISFAADLRSGMRGFYRSEMGGRIYASTQFEPAEARTAFPCLDEPAQKATLDLTLIVGEADVALANGAPLDAVVTAGRRRVRFARVGPLPPFLMAWVIGPFAQGGTRITPGGCAVTVWLPHDQPTSAGAVALSAHVEALEWLEAYFGERCPVVKLDAVGVPQLAAGAMENPGLFTYRLAAICADGTRLPLAAEQTIFTTAAHECAHLWFGDLVTIAWWDDLWLAEAMATLLANRVVADIRPSWHPWLSFLARREAAFALDELSSSHPVAVEVRDVAATRYQFDAITYLKGASLLRMLEDWVGPEAFRDGLRRYVNGHRDGIATRGDLRSALAAGTPLAALVCDAAEEWCTSTGFVTVRFEPTIEPSRAWVGLLTGAELTGSSPLPLTVRRTDDLVPATQRFLISRGGHRPTELPGNSVLPNPGGLAYVRTSHPLAWLARAGSTTLTPEEQLALFLDAWACVRGGRATIGELLSALPFLAKGEPVALSTALGVLRWLDANVAESRPLVRAAARTTYAHISTTSGFQDARIGAAAAAVATEAMGRIVEDDDTLVDCTRVAASWCGGAPINVDVEMLGACLAVAARQGSDALLEAVLAGLKASVDPQLRSILMRAAASFRAVDAIDRVFDTCVSGLPPQDRPGLFDLLLREPAARDRVAERLISMWDEFEVLDPIARDRMTVSLAHVVNGTAARAVAQHLAARTREDIAATRALERLRLDQQAAVCIALGSAAQPAIAPPDTGAEVR